MKKPSTPIMKKPSTAATRNKNRKKKSSKLAAVSVYKAEEILSSFDCLQLIKRLKLTGCAVDSRGILVVEGGIQAVNKFNKLITVSTTRKLDVAWQGRVVKPSFGKFSILHCGSDSSARKFFCDHGVSQYWDVAVGKST